MISLTTTPIGTDVAYCAHCHGPMSYDHTGQPFCRCREHGLFSERVGIRWTPVVAYIGVIATLTWILWR